MHIVRLFGVCGGKNFGVFIRPLFGVDVSFFMPFISALSLLWMNFVTTDGVAGHDYFCADLRVFLVLLAIAAPFA